MKIVLATCATWPQVSAGDRPLAEELAHRGHDVQTRPWNDSPLSDFTTADLVVLRSNWDFHNEMEAFEHWLSTVDSSTARIENAAELVATHTHKSYLLRYAAAGLPTPATLVLPSFDATAIGRWMDERGLERAVCKPAWGASGHQVSLLARGLLTDAEGRWNRSDDRRDLIIQEFVPEVRNGELALVFFAGVFSHALRRLPAGEDFRVNSQYGGQMELDPNVEPAAVAFAQQVVRTIRPTPSYARIDLVATNDFYLLMEVELNEPALGLHLAAGSAVAFADALLG
jgi:glutathione synthase/RimK-type ligase-like ATP-grasp enzyme